jgi:Flp pilus assembly protein TadG
MRRVKPTGQALAELALVIPIIIFMITTFLDMGRAIFSYSSLSNAVREGTRYAIVHDPDNAAEIESIVKSYLSGMDPNDITVNSGIVTLADTDGIDTDYINVTASYNFDPVTPGLAAILGGGGVIPMIAESQMVFTPCTNNPNC